VIDLDLVSVFCRQITTFPATFVKDAVYFPLYGFGAIVKNKVGIAVWIHIRVLYSVSLVFITVLCQYPPVFIAITLQYSLRLGIVISPALLFFTEYFLDYLRSLVFPNEY
jgi:hypothetical protein